MMVKQCDSPSDEVIYIHWDNNTTLSTPTVESGPRVLSDRRAGFWGAVGGYLVYPAVRPGTHESD
ncbi:uncharacterized protein N7529_008575 [Penicillium soppii]|uniref:uncharacterized protein n=1 Tax=Penicillium soppii TaxID=69789 RepID=UPI002549136E|nr:uncharacterized protein N7529_008575 [Penicillium soppii]KAJ5861265.1 hypothetical protein N7529_008575 [Penicillium soppii]